MNVVIIVQARMTSTRLSGKVLKQVLGKPLLGYVIERLRRVSGANDLVIATTTNRADVPIVQLCQALGVNYFRGDENNVLQRYYQAAVQAKADVIVRVTSDCPLTDPEIIDKAITYFIDNAPKFDYVSNCITRTYPRGVDVEVFSFDALELAFKEATLPAELEHVTPYIHRRPELFTLGSITQDQDLSFHRWTVDEEADFQLIKTILEALYPAKPKFAMQDVLSLLSQHPAWIKINAHVEQKHV